MLKPHLKYPVWPIVTTEYDEKEESMLWKVFNIHI